MTSLLSTILPLPAHLAYSKQMTVQSLRVEGTRREVQLETRAGDRFDRGRMTKDVKRLWSTGWFSNVSAAAHPDKGGVDVVFEVTEQAQFRLRRVSFKSRKDKQDLGLDPGFRINTPMAQQIAAQLKRDLVGQGFKDANVVVRLVPTAAHEADLEVEIQRGRKYRLQKVTFVGNPALETNKLAKQLHSPIRRVLPGVPGLWSGWTLQPAYSEQSLEFDLLRLRSFYMTQGYFDAKISVERVEFSTDAKVSVTIGIDAGRRYRVKDLQLPNSEPVPSSGRNGNFPSQELCRYLVEVQREAEKHGKLDFLADVQVIPVGLSDIAAKQPQQQNERVNVLPPATPTVSLAALVSRGPSYSVGRVNFLGNEKVSDLTLRRALTLSEGDLLDLGKLRGSLARLNRLPFLQAVREENVELDVNRDTHRVNVTIPVRETKSARWSLSGPAGPIQLFGALQFSLESRLPNWGRPAWELSTYYASFALLGFSQPVLNGLRWDWKTLWMPVYAFRQPLLPGRFATSGFVVLPQWGWRGSALATGAERARALASARLDRPTGRFHGEVVFPVHWRPPPDQATLPGAASVGPLFCKPEKGRLSWIRSAGRIVMANLLSGP